MTKIELTENEKLADYFVTRLEMLRLRLVENIADIDKLEDEIERRLKD